MNFSLPPASQTQTDATAFVRAVLVDGPAELPADARECLVLPDATTIKVPHYGGYEHFRYDGTDQGSATAVFRWVGRTRVAE
jgi:hypothetical protein